MTHLSIERGNFVIASMNDSLNKIVIQVHLALKYSVWGNQIDLEDTRGCYQDLSKGTKYQVSTSKYQGHI